LEGSRKDIAYLEVTIPGGLFNKETFACGLLLVGQEIERKERKERRLIVGIEKGN
jgi:hypothetical protein